MSFVWRWGSEGPLWRHSGNGVRVFIVELFTSVTRAFCSPGAFETRTKSSWHHARQGRNTLEDCASNGETSRRKLEEKKCVCVCVCVNNTFLWAYYQFQFHPKKKKSISKKSNDKKAGHLSDAVLLIQRLFHPQFTIAVAGKVDLRLNSGLQTLLASRKVEKKAPFPSRLRHE